MVLFQPLVLETSAGVSIQAADHANRTSVPFYSGDEQVLIETIQLVLSCLLLPLIFIIISGNVLVIVVMWHYPWLRCSTTYCILSLAVVDLLIGAIDLPLQLGLGFHTVHPSGLCLFIHTLDPALCQISILHVLVLNIDRFIAITRPLRYPQIVSSGRMLLCILGCWVVGIVVSLGPAVGVYKYDKFCDAVMSADASTISTSFLFWLPLSITCIIYLRIVQIAHRQARRINAYEGTVCCFTTKNAASPSNMYEITPRSSQKRMLKTVAGVVGALVCCWVPYFTNILIIAHSGIKYESMVALQITAFLGYINSALNPFIYARSSSDYRKAFRKLLCPCQKDEGLKSVSTLVRGIHRISNGSM